MQSTRHSEIVNKMRGFETSNSISVSHTERGTPQVVYENCTFNVEDMYCNK